MVAHDGGVASGEYRYTLTMTDIATGWTVNRSVLNQARTRAVSPDSAVPEVLTLCTGAACTSRWQRACA